MAAVAVALGTALVPLAVRNLESAVDSMKQAIVRSRQKPSTHTYHTTVGQGLSNWWHRPAIEAAQARAEAAALQAAAATILASAPPEAGLAAAAAPAAEAAEAASPGGAPGGAPAANNPALSPFDQFAAAVEEDPKPLSGGKRRNKSRKARKGSRKARKGSRRARKGSRKARKGLKSRRA